jgi:hypothetical protein
VEKPATPAEWPGCAKPAMSVGGVSSGERRRPGRLHCAFWRACGRSKLRHSLDARPAREDIDRDPQPGTALFSVAIFEAARFALMCHFLCSEDLLSCQAFCNDVSVFGRQLTVLVAR